MAKNNTNYFSHDWNAHDDPKIIKLCIKYWYEWVWLYRTINEYLFNEWGYISNDIEALAFLLRCDAEKLASVFSYMIEVGLYEQDKEKFWSESLLRRLKAKEEKKQRYADAWRKGWLARQAMLKQSSSDGWSDAKAPLKHKSKVKESKVKEINKGGTKKKKAGQIITYSDQFIEFREMGPKTWDKSKAFESYELVIDAWIDADLLKAKIAEYKEQQIYKNWNAKKYTKHVSTWLNNQGRENEYDTWPEYFTDEHFQRYVKNCVWKDTYYCPFDKKEYKCQISSYSYAWWVAKRTWEDINELEKKAERPYDNFTNPDRI